jgi:Domain of unknown function (DUF1996)
MKRCVVPCLFLIIAALLGGLVMWPQGVAAGRVASFNSQCQPDHTAKDDPIVFPGRPGASHSHDFFGAVGIDAFSTARDLRGGATTCRDSRDTAGYWVPTLYLDGQPVPARYSAAYYSAGGKDRSSIKPFPHGLEMVAGGTRQTVSWGCRDQGAAVRRLRDGPGDFFECLPEWDAATVAHVEFPDCWDGVNLEAPDQSHMTYAGASRSCPKSHPVPVPEISLHINYGVLPPGVPTLASGDPSTLHADFINSWHQPRLKRLIQECIQGGRNCREASLVD